ncbi:ADOP family duplicated permease [Gemmatimonadota bacterium]
MPFLPRITSGFRSLFRKVQLDRDLEEELRCHLELLTDEKIESGMDPQRARREALLELGGSEQVKEKVREIRIGFFIDTFGRDVRHALRSLLRKPGFLAFAVLTLALGIGITTTLFSVVSAVILRPLPFAEPGRLVRINEVTPQGRVYTTSEPTFLSWREMVNPFTDIGGYDGLFPVGLSGEGEPVTISAASVSHSILPLLGIEPLLGRSFTPEDDLPGEASRVALVSYRLWSNRFGSDPSIVGKSLSLDGTPYVVIGVVYLDRTLRFDGDVLLPLAPDPGASRSNHYITTIGRLAPGVTREQAQAGMDVIAAELSEAYPASNGGWGAVVSSLEEWLVGTDIRRIVLILLGAVGLILLLACANVSNLLIARGTVRLKEIGLRAALGASRGRIIRQLLTESAVLAGMGAVVGLLLTVCALPVVRSISSTDIPRLDQVNIDGNLLLFAVLVTLLSTLLFGLVPALQISRHGLSEMLKKGAASSHSSHSSHRARNALVVCELALATIVLIGAGLMTRSFVRLLEAETGFDPSNRVTTRLQLPGSSTAQERLAFFRAVEERVASLPGVEAVGSSFLDLFSGSHTSNRVSSPDLDPQSPNEFLPIEWRTVTSGFFGAMGIPLMAGRVFNELDGSPEDGSEFLPIIVSEGLAGRLWPGENPVGRRVIWSRPGGSEFVVIGIVGDILDYRIDEAPMPTLYVPFNAQTWQAMSVVIKVAIDPSGLAAAIRNEIRTLDANMVVPEIVSLEEKAAVGREAHLFTMRLFGVFAALALTMAAMGVYAVIFFQVTQRTREIGIRMALGADAGRIRGMVLRHSLLRIGIGLATGVVASLGLTRLMAGMLYETDPTDPFAYAGVLATLAAVAVIATLVPTIRATRIDPRTAFIAE